MEKRRMTRQEAGRRGGERTKAKHGANFFAQIGRQGGRVSSGNFRNDPERAKAAGRKGGMARHRPEA
jgi:uncharacterized protein